jgi:hypothetical protein
MQQGIFLAVIHAVPLIEAEAGRPAPINQPEKEKHMSHMTNSIYKLLAFVAMTITLAFAQTAQAGTAAEIDAAVRTGRWRSR